MDTNKRVSGVASATLATIILMGPYWAEDARLSGTAPAMAPSSIALPHHGTGEIVSVNKPANLCALKTSQGAMMIFAIDGSTLPQLSVLTKGERVKVTYKNSRGQSFTTKITPA